MALGSYSGSDLPPIASIMKPKRATVAQAKKLAKQKRFAVKEKDRGGLSVEQTRMKMTTYFKDTGQTEVSELELSPSKKRRILLAGNDQLEASKSTWIDVPASIAEAATTTVATGTV
ncbi:hypothetical protein PQX77_002827 [Marasmius sp. AFHP31]|nr:hypothetical protein PQX77_002827 [Marasmius sp. AFHP31]